jgi:hypothetical protein
MRPERGATPSAMVSPLQRDRAARADHIRLHPETDAGIANHGVIGGVEKEPRHAGPECVAALEIAVAGGEGNSAARLQVCGAAEGESNGGAGARLAVVIDDLRLQPNNLRLEAGGETLQLTNVHRIGLADAGRDVGDAPLGARRADRHGVGHIGNRARAERDRVRSRRRGIWTDGRRPRSGRICAIAK